MPKHSTSPLAWLLPVIELSLVVVLASFLAAKI
jgi:hypothetical protein